MTDTRLGCEDVKTDVEAECQGADRRVALRVVIGRAFRVLLLFAGVVVMTFGIDLMSHANLGTTPISAIPYVLSLDFSQVSFGQLTIIWNVLLILGQIVILRRDFKIVDFLQIPVSVFFGVCLDVFAALLSSVTANVAVQSFALLLLGIVALALGISLTVLSNSVMNCGEAFARALSDKFGWDFGHVKVGFDLSLVALAGVCSVVLMGDIEGVGVGSLIAAAVTGFIVNLCLALARYVKNKICSSGAAAV